MDLRFSTGAWEDYLHWQTADRNVALRLNALIKDISRSPFEGIGKPEPLKEILAGWWSRRITAEHRIVDRVVGGGSKSRFLRSPLAGTITADAAPVTFRACSETIESNSAASPGCHLQCCCGGCAIVSGQAPRDR